MDSRVPGVPKEGALEAQRQSSLKLVRLALREPGLLKRYFRGKERPKRYFRGKERPAKRRRAPPPLRYAVQGFAPLRRRLGVTAMVNRV